MDEITDSTIYRRTFDAFVVAEWDNWTDDVAIWHMHPDYPNSFRLSEAEEFFHHCLKKFERQRVGVAQVIDEDSELTEAIDGGDDEDGPGDNDNLKVERSKNKKPKKKLPVEKYEQDESSEESDDDDDDEDDEDIPMAKLSVK